MITKLHVILETPNGKRICIYADKMTSNAWILPVDPGGAWSRDWASLVLAPISISATAHQLHLYSPSSSCFSTLLHGHLLKTQTRSCHFHFQYPLRTPIAYNLHLNSYLWTICATFFSGFFSRCLALQPMFQLSPTAHQPLSITIPLYFAWIDSSG